MLLKGCKKTFHSLAAMQIQGPISPLVKLVLSAFIQCRKTHRQRSWTLAPREHFDHGNSSVKAKTNKWCTSNTKADSWWNSIFRLLVSCILVSIQPSERCIITHWMLFTRVSVSKLCTGTRFFFCVVFVNLSFIQDLALFPSETVLNWYNMLTWARCHACLDPIVYSHILITYFAVQILTKRVRIWFCMDFLCLRN